jgi:hypothetical protein
MAAASMASPQFGLVVLTATAIGLQVVWTGARAGMTRSSTLDAALSEKKDTPEYAKLLADHKNATGGDDFPKGGYPDMGTGRLATLMSYDQWL